MYRCQSCAEVSRPGERQHQVVVLTREKRYPYRPAVHRFRRAGKLEVQDDPGGAGRETVKELKVCAPCKRMLEGDGAL